MAQIYLLISTKFNKNPKNYENHKIQGISRQNNKNQKKSYQNHENHEIHKIQCQNNDIAKHTKLLLLSFSNYSISVVDYKRTWRPELDINF